jgi:ornithine decarboxylase
VQNELLLGSRAAALREVLRALECDAATRTLLDGFMPDIPGIMPFVPTAAGHTEHILRALAAAGAGFSIATLADLQLLPSLGVDPRAVLCRNTVTQPADVRAAALRGVWRFAIDSERELQTVAGAAPGASVYVYVAVHGAGTSDTPGASAHEALRLLRLGPELGLRPYGLAFHVGPAPADPSMYARAIDRCGLVMRRLEQLGTRIEMLALGGSLGAADAESVVPAAIGRLPYRPPLLVAEP